MGQICAVETRLVEALAVSTYESMSFSYDCQDRSQTDIESPLWSVQTSWVIPHFIAGAEISLLNRYSDCRYSDSGTDRVHATLTEASSCANTNGSVAPKRRSVCEDGSAQILDAARTNRSGIIAHPEQSFSENLGPSDGEEESMTPAMPL
jgi:hypothetical protein